MTDDLLIDAFIQVFRGRGDVYGNAKGYCENVALTRPVFERHLRSTNPADHIGVYCMVGTNASWGCIDIDGKDFMLPDCLWTKDDGHSKCSAACDWDWDRMLALAAKLRSVLNHAPGGPIYGHVERTKNGYHVWVFPEQPLVPAAAMRRALMAACAAIGYDPKEVNPKAEGPRPGTKGYGNFVRLPYGGALADGWEFTARYMLADAWVPARLTEALVIVSRYRTPLAHLEAAAALWTPPAGASDRQVDFNAGLEVEPLLPLLDGKSYTIWKDGPLPGSDRSTTLARLAHLLAERGLTATQAFAVTKSADERWGRKFADRADGDEQIARLIENAYG